MIIHCLSCGKAVSSHSGKCPYCVAEVTDLTLEMNGVMTHVSSKNRLKNLVLQLVNRQAVKSKA